MDENMNTREKIMSERWDVYTRDRKRTGSAKSVNKRSDSFGFEENPVPSNRYQDIIGQVVSGKIDRPKGSCHPRRKEMVYPINYGYVTGIKGGKFYLCLVCISTENI